MVGGDRIDDPARKAGPDRRHVGSGAKRGVDFEDRVVALHRGVAEDQVMGSDLSRHRQPVGLRRADQLDGSRR